MCVSPPQESVRFPQLLCTPVTNWTLLMNELTDYSFDAVVCLGGMQVSTAIRVFSHQFSHFPKRVSLSPLLWTVQVSQLDQVIIIARLLLQCVTTLVLSPSPSILLGLRMFFLFFPLSFQRDGSSRGMSRQSVRMTLPASRCKLVVLSKTAV